MSAAARKRGPGPVLSTETRTAAGIEYTLIRRKVKQMHLRVRRDGTVAVSAWPRASAAEIDRFVAANADWVARAKAARQAESAAEAAPLPDKARAQAQMQAICERYFVLFAGCVAGPLPEICIRDMSSRWGVCNLKRRRITFAQRLVQKPLAAQEYVAMHELCHLLVPNHSALFWAEVAQRMPDWKARRALLR